jgi:hypothetical protein
MALRAGFKIDLEGVHSLTVPFAHRRIRYSQVAIRAIQPFFGVAGVAIEVPFVRVACRAKILCIANLESCRVGIVAANASQFTFAMDAFLPLGMGVYMAGTT